MSKSKKNSTLNDNSKTIDGVIDFLSTLADEAYQLRVWGGAEGPEVDWYDETIDLFDTQIDFFKNDLRHGVISLSKEQIKAVLRVLVMINHFERRLVPWGESPDGWCEEQLFVIEQPYWQKVRKQAAHALSLLKNTSDQ